LHCARSEHQPYAAQQASLHPQFRDPRLGFLAVIAFPNYFARSFGELGVSARWRHWGCRLAALAIPVRCCFLEAVSLIRGCAAA
jgi:hypothetical protein